MSEQAEPRRATWKSRLALLASLAGFAYMLHFGGCGERFFYLPTREATPPPARLEQITGSPAEALWFESSDGTRLRGWFIPAAGRDPRDALTVVHLHGNAGSMLSHIAFSAHFPLAGFNLFLFDYRGYGESQGVATHRDPLIEDAKAAVATVRARGDVDPDRIALYGHSLGAGIAVNVLADDPRLLGAVLESPISSWRLAAATALGGSPPPVWSRFLSVWLVHDDRSPVEAIAGTPQPILIVHGDADTIVPVLHGRRLADAAPSARLIEYPGGEHNSLQETHPAAVEAMHEFLREIDGGAGARRSP